ncbi:unnamed protein product [Brassica rapa subsp. narinosa]
MKQKTRILRYRRANVGGSTHLEHLQRGMTSSPLASILTDPVRGRRGGERLDGGAFVFGNGEKKIHFDESKEKKNLSTL